MSAKRSHPPRRRPYTSITTAKKRAKSKVWKSTGQRGRGGKSLAIRAAISFPTATFPAAVKWMPSFSKSVEVSVAP